MTVAHNMQPYPHAGGCAVCRAFGYCNYCGAAMPKAIDRCTNGRCIRCHRNVCTPGGATSSGHGFGKEGPSA